VVPFDRTARRRTAPLRYVHRQRNSCWRERAPSNGAAVLFDGAAVLFDGAAVPFGGAAVPFDGAAVPFDGAAVSFDGAAGL
jgi:hypothetical protein